MRSILILINANIIAKDGKYLAVSNIYKLKDLGVQLRIKSILHIVRTACKIAQIIVKRRTREK